MRDKNDEIYNKKYGLDYNFDFHFDILADFNDKLTK